MSADELDKETGSSDGLQPKQADLSCVHALNELHLHEIHVVPSMHEADQFEKNNYANVIQDVNHINFFDVEYPEMLNEDERVANDLNKLKSDSSSSSVSGSNLNVTDFSIDSGNDADSSDGLVATQNEEVATLEENVFSECNLDQDLCSSQGVQNVRRSSRQSVFPRNYNDFVVVSKVKYGLEKYIEIDALLRNDTWKIIELHEGRKVIGSKWIYKIKFKSSGEIDRYKARLVAQGFGQKEGSGLYEPPEGYFPSDNKSKSDCSLYTKSNKGVFIALLVYVDDTIITGIYLNQRKYVLDLLSEYGMLACKPEKNPFMSKLFISNEASENDPLLKNVTDYQKLTGKLIYLTNTTPDISCVVYCLSQFMHTPLSSHLKIAFKILRYLKSCLVIGYCVFLNNSLVFGKVRNETLSLNLQLKQSIELLLALASVTSKVIWILNFLKDLQIENLLPVLLHYDSNSTIKIAANPDFHERIKHLEIDLHFVREKILNGVAKTVKVDSEHQIVDILTKRLDTIQHRELFKKTWLLPHAGGLGFEPLRDGFPSGAKKKWGLSPKTKVRVLHTYKIECYCELESLTATFRTMLSCNKWSYAPHDVVNLYKSCISLFYN
nr:hypothetical protein [Tanacetum cinerariifolium]